MKKILKHIKGIMGSGTYNHYRLIVSPDKIELKLRPRNNKTEEVNWCMDNEKHNRRNLASQLEELNLKH